MAVTGLSASVASVATTGDPATLAAYASQAGRHSPRPLCGVLDAARDEPFLELHVEYLASAPPPLAEDSGEEP